MVQIVERKEGAVQPRKQSRQQDFATFIITPSGGLKHTVVLRPMEYQTVRVEGSESPKVMPVIGTERKVKFDDGRYMTADPEYIDLMLKSTDYGRDFEIDPNDPTGYWEKRGIIKTKKREVVDVEVDEAAVMQARMGTADVVSG